MAKPKQQRVNDAKEALGLAQQRLAKKQENLNQIQGHLTSLKKQHKKSLDEQEALKEKKVLTGVRLERASVLIAALSNEKVRMVNWRLFGRYGVIRSAEDLDVRCGRCEMWKM